MIVILIIGISILLSGCISVNECNFDEECVPIKCCHADKCVLKEYAPSCESVFCTAVCEPGTMDCGQGYCGCVNGKCKVMNKPGSGQQVV